MTNAELAILSLVAEKPRHGYEIEQVIEARGMRDWTEIGFSSIYYLLKKLERKGLVSGKRQTSTGPGKARIVYSIEPAGRRALKHNVSKTLSTLEPAPPAFLLGLANLPVLGKEDVLDALQKYHTALDARERGLKEKGHSVDPAPYFVQAMFDYSLALLEAERSWVIKFIDLVEANDGKD